MKGGSLPTPAKQGGGGLFTGGGVNLPGGGAIYRLPKCYIYICGILCHFT